MDEVGLQRQPNNFVALVGVRNFSVSLQYAVSADCSAFAARYHPLPRGGGER